MSKLAKTIIGLFITMLLLGLIISVIIAVKIKESEVYQVSQEYIKHNDEVLREVGKIEGYSFFTFGSIESSHKRGEAFLRYTVKGTKGKAKIHIVLEKDSSNQWIVKDFWTYN